MLLNSRKDDDNDTKNEGILLQKIGFTISWSIDIRHGKHNIGSIRLPNLYLEQFTQLLSIFLRNLQHHETAQLMDNIITMYQM